MARFLQELGNGIRSLSCAVLSANEYINGGIGIVAPGLRDLFNDQINATRRLVGCDPAEDITPPVPPFTGGQCAGIRYQVNGTFTDRSNGALCGQTRTWQTGNPKGPIGGVFQEGGFWYFSCGETAGKIQCLLNASSPLTVGTEGQCLPSQAAGGVNALGVSITSVVRVDGQPDNCGNPPITYPPPTNIDFNIDVTYQPDFGPQITVPINIEFSPTTINFDGSVRFPLSFDFGGFTFEGSLSFNPDLSVTINAPIRLPRGTGQPTDTLPPQTDPQPISPADFDRIIIGVAVQSTVDGEQQFTSIAQIGQPSILAPRVGSIKFAYSIGVATFWSSDIDVKGANVFIPCPFSQGADAVVVSAAPGVAVTWQPVYGFPLATAEDVDSAAGLAVGA